MIIHVMNHLKHILLTLFLTVLIQTVSATTWVEVYPFTQKTEGQDVVVKSIPYDPYGIREIGVTRVYLKNKLLYSIDRYFREGFLTSNDGQYLAVVHTSNTYGLTSFSSVGGEQIDFNESAIDIYKNGELFRTFTLNEVIDTTKILSNGRFFQWSYYLNFRDYDNAIDECESCKEVYGRRILRLGDTTKISYMAFACVV